MFVYTCVQALSIDTVFPATELTHPRMSACRLYCPGCGDLYEAVPWARAGSPYTRDFDDLVAWLAQQMSQTQVTRLRRSRRSRARFDTCSMVPVTRWTCSTTCSKTGTGRCPGSAKPSRQSASRLRIRTDGCRCPSIRARTASKR
jgi:hypothetical protein